MTTLNWIGKEAVVKHHKEVPFRLLEVMPELSCGDAASGNLASLLRRDKCNINWLRLICSRGFLGRGSSLIGLISRNKRRRLTSSLSRLKWEASLSHIARQLEAVRLSILVPE